MNWQNNRPLDWVTLKAKNNPLHCFAPDACVGQSYEAGADAMLNAVREKLGNLSFLLDEEVKDGK